MQPLCWTVQSYCGLILLLIFANVTSGGETSGCVVRVTLVDQETERFQEKPRKDEGPDEDDCLCKTAGPVRSARLWNLPLNLDIHMYKNKKKFSPPVIFFVENISIPTEMQQSSEIPPGLKVKVFSHTDRNKWCENVKRKQWRIH